MDTSLVSTVHNILDIVIIEGLYPYLSGNVGPQNERRKKSAFYQNLKINLPNLDLVDTVLWKTLKTVTFDLPKGLSRVVRDRHLIDIIAAEIDLAYAPRNNDILQVKARTAFEETSKQFVNLSSC